MAPTPKLRNLTRDWRQSAWNRWLVSYLAPAASEARRDREEGTRGTPGDDSAAPADTEAPENATDSQLDESSTSQASNGAQPASKAPASSNRSHESGSNGSGRAPEAYADVHDEPESVDPEEQETLDQDAGEDEEAERHVRRSRSYRHASTGRERYAALLEQQMLLNDAVDALTHRVQLMGTYQRASSEQLRSLLERTLESLDTDEKQRLEQALSRLEERLTRLETRVEAQAYSTRDSSATAPARRQPSIPASNPSIWQRHDSIYEQFSASMSGSLTELSLPTLLGMLELERRTGRLRLRHEARIAIFWFSQGNVVRCELDGAPADPVAVLREAVDWSEGRFTFTVEEVDAQDAEPRSMGSLLLEATQLNDEAVR